MKSSAPMALDGHGLISALSLLLLLLLLPFTAVFDMSVFLVDSRFFEIALSSYFVMNLAAASNLLLISLRVQFIDARSLGKSRLPIALARDT
jgi:hypothetical protein